MSVGSVLGQIVEFSKKKPHIADYQQYAACLFVVSQGFEP